MGSFDCYSDFLLPIQEVTHHLVDILHPAEVYSLCSMLQIIVLVHNLTDYSNKIIMLETFMMMFATKAGDPTAQSFPTNVWYRL
ncbi:hypothetical protein QVD17_26481 [Tagetes erecta]|uniref:Uncharacterized protein n=1 Tax=Tagetes erecta TaxID=13708 RepID=A0AAD8K6P9_TARER|nr:hypothetical protein QVD17_26481 [Tagetes erecta]